MAIDAKAGKVKRKRPGGFQPGDRLATLHREGKPFTPVLARSGASWYLLSAQLAGGIMGHVLGSPDKWRTSQGRFRALPDDMPIDELRSIQRLQNASELAHAGQAIPDPVDRRPHSPKLPRRSASQDE